MARDKPDIITGDTELDTLEGRLLQESRRQAIAQSDVTKANARGIVDILLGDPKVTTTLGDRPLVVFRGDFLLILSVDCLTSLLRSDSSIDDELLTVTRRSSSSDPSFLQVMIRTREHLTS